MRKLLNSFINLHLHSVNSSYLPSVFISLCLLPSPCSSPTPSPMFHPTHFFLSTIFTPKSPYTSLTKALHIALVHQSIMSWTLATTGFKTLFCSVGVRNSSPLFHYLNTPSSDTLKFRASSPILTHPEEHAITPTPTPQLPLSPASASP